MSGLSYPKSGRGRPSLALVLHLVQAPGQECLPHLPLEQGSPKDPPKGEVKLLLQVRSTGLGSAFTAVPVPADTGQDVGGKGGAGPAHLPPKTRSSAGPFPPPATEGVAHPLTEELRALLWQRPLGFLKLLAPGQINTGAKAGA